MHQVHRVKPDRVMAPPPLPHDSWQGRTFIEASGEKLLVVWDGDRHGPTLCASLWPLGMSRTLRTIGHPVVTP